MKKLITSLLLFTYAVFAQAATQQVVWPKPLQTGSTALEASRVVKTTAGTLMLLTGYNSLASPQFIQVHNTTSLPADGAVPVWVGTASASSTFSFSFFPTGLVLSTGITISNSTTAPTKTIGAANCWYVAIYY
jgi:hypothetical protein